MNLYKDDKKIKSKILIALDFLQNNQIKINYKWLNSMSNTDFNSLVMEIFDLNNLRRSLIDFDYLSLKTKEIIKNEISRIESKEKNKKNKWLIHLNEIKNLGFKIVEKSEINKELEILLIHNLYFIMIYIKGSYLSGVKSSQIFFNGVIKKNIAPENAKKYITNTNKKLNITVGSANIEYSPATHYNNILNCFSIEDFWIESEVENYVSNLFLEDNIQLIEKEILKKMYYYNITKNNKAKSILNLSCFEDKFSKAFYYLSYIEIEKIHIRTILLNLKIEDPYFFKKELIDHFNNHNIKNEEYKYLRFYLLNELEKNPLKRNPFDFFIDSIENLDKEDCLELINIINKNKNKKYSRYKINDVNKEYLYKKIRLERLDTII